jgi:hypothetical protein
MRLDIYTWLTYRMSYLDPRSSLGRCCGSSSAAEQPASRPSGSFGWTSSTTSPRCAGSPTRRRGPAGCLAASGSARARSDLGELVQPTPHSASASPRPAPPTGASRPGSIRSSPALRARSGRRGVASLLRRVAPQLDRLAGHFQWIAPGPPLLRHGTRSCAGQPLPADATRRNIHIRPVASEVYPRIFGFMIRVFSQVSRLRSVLNSAERRLSEINRFDVKYMSCHDQSQIRWTGSG